MVASNAMGTNTQKTLCGKGRAREAREAKRVSEDG